LWREDKGAERNNSLVKRWKEEWRGVIEIEKKKEGGKNKVGRVLAIV